MWFVRCPHCSEDIRTPANLAPTAQVQCPLCGEKFAGAILLDRLPPTVIVLDSGTGERADHFETAALSSQQDSVEPLGSSTRPQTVASEPFQFDEVEAPIGERHRPTVYSSSPPRSGTNEFFKIVAGGVVGLILAVLILWWGFERDPFTLAPKVAKYTPWLIPPDLQPLPSEDTTPPWPSSDGKELPQAALNGFDGPPEMPNGAPFGPPTDESNSPENDSHFGGGGRGAKSGGLMGGASDSPNYDSTPVFGPLRRVPVSQAPSFTVDDVLAAFVTVERMWSALQELDISESPAAFTLNPDFYQALCRLAECVTYVDNDPRTARIRQQIATALEDYAGHQYFRLLIDRATRTRLSSRDTAIGDGLCLRGHVQDIHPHGNLFVTRIALPGRPSRFLSVLSAIDPRKFYLVGSDVILLGSIVDRPSRRIQGYRGRINRVIIGGLATQVATEHPPEPLDSP